MKTTLPFILMFFILFSATAQIVNIPDPVFKQALLGQGVDTNFDEEIQVSEAEAVTGHLDVNGQFFDIYDMTGIEAFINITELSCGLNEISTLDLSQNTQLTYLDCYNNPLINLNINQCVNLEYLYLGYTELVTLDVNNNMNLKDFSISHSHIFNLDLTQNTNLETIGFSDMNELTTVDIRNGGNNNIIAFGSHNNINLTCIFVDDSEYMETNFGSNIDFHTHFVETQAECDALGLNELQIEDIEIYPNPIKERLHIDINSEIGIQNSELIIADITGKRILQIPLFEQSTMIDLGKLHQGMYFLTIFKNNKKLLTKKILKL